MLQRLEEYDTWQSDSVRIIQDESLFVRPTTTYANCPCQLDLFQNLRRLHICPTRVLRKERELKTMDNSHVY